MALSLLLLVKELAKEALKMPKQNSENFTLRSWQTLFKAVYLISIVHLFSVEVTTPIKAKGVYESRNLPVLSICVLVFLPAPFIQKLVEWQLDLKPESNTSEFLKIGPNLLSLFCLQFASFAVISSHIGHTNSSTLELVSVLSIALFALLFSALDKFID